MAKNRSSSSSSIKKIAEESGVSIATVSRVFNGSSLVRPELAMVILGVAERHNYTPKQSQRRDTMALVLEDTTSKTFSSYVSAFLKELVQKCAERRLRLDIVPSEEIGLIRGKYIKGVIALLWEKKSLERLRRVKNAPVVAVNASFDGANVCTDEKQGLELALAYLEKHGHHSIGLITRDFDSYGDCCRREKFKKLIAAKSYLCGTSIVYDGTEPSLLSAVAKAVRRSDPGKKNASGGLTALIATSEDTGIILMHCLDLLGLRVPEDISVISHEALNQSEFLIPAHTTLMQDYVRLADAALMALEDASGSDSRSVLVPYRLIERQSVRSIQ